MRYADRNQTVRYSTFNWTPIAANWNCNGPGFNADNTTGGRLSDRPELRGMPAIPHSGAMARASGNRPRLGSNFYDGNGL